MIDIVDNPFTRAKKERLDKLKRILPSLLPLEFRKVVAYIENDTGVSQKVAKDYLRVLSDIDAIIVECGMVKMKVYN